MGLPAYPLVWVYIRDCNTGDQIFPAFLPYEELIKDEIIEIMQGKKLMMSPSQTLVDLDVIPVIFEFNNIFI